MSRGGFSTRAALGLIAGAAGLLLLLGWAVGHGLADGDLNDGGGHAGGTGLNGYAALYRLLGAAGYNVSLARDPAALRQPGLLVLTPAMASDPAELDRVTTAHRAVGPVLVLQPKWVTLPANPNQPGYRKGWVVPLEGNGAEWPGFRDDIRWQVKPLAGRLAFAPGMGLTLHLPAPDRVVSAQGLDLSPLVVGGDGRDLAFYTTDGAPFPALARIAAAPARVAISRCDFPANCRYPLVFVVEPDLLDNWGMARPENAALAEAVVGALLADGPPGGERRRVVFDLTFDGLARHPGLFTVMFTPPWLAATLCLLLAGFALVWRGMARFGPVARPPRALAFGKRALIESAAGLVVRARRHHLLAAPYAAALRERVARALGLARGTPAALDAAIDRALAARAPAEPSFSAAVAELLAARGPVAIVKAARALRRIETIITEGELNHA